jgi:hypothetical protein
LVFASTAVDAFVSKINGHLPKPLFSSIANMTRIVAWEAKKSLEIPGDLEHFQWTNVNRNDQGGITLSGLCRDDVPQNGDYDLGRKVRAQCYCINTDLWGRIVKTDVTFKQVPPAPYGPQGELLRDSLGQELFRDVPVQSWRN